MGRKPLLLRIDEATHRALAEMAKKERSSVNLLCERALKDLVDTGRPLAAFPVHGIVVDDARVAVRFRGTNPVAHSVAEEKRVKPWDDRQHRTYFMGTKRIGGDDFIALQGVSGQGKKTTVHNMLVNPRCVASLHFPEKDDSPE